MISKSPCVLKIFLFEASCLQWLILIDLGLLFRTVVKLKVLAELGLA